MKNRIDLFVPGRLCLFGEHTDWAGRYMNQNADILSGKAIVTGINLGIYAHAELSDMFEVQTIDDKGNILTTTCEMRTDILKEKALDNSFFSYCYGVAAYMRENYKVNGLKIVVDNVTLPMKKGLSSSAAICVLVARAFNKMYELHLSTKGEMLSAYYGERLTQSRCGRLDQACAYGERPVLMEFTDEGIGIEKLSVGANLYWVFVDLCAKKNTKKILTHLNRSYPYAQNEADIQVQEALGKDNHRIIASVCRAMQDGDAEQLGKLMTEAQNIFDSKVAPVCMEELEAPVLHSVINDPNIQKWIYGAKGVGSQGDGTGQLLAKDKESQLALVDYLNNVRNMQAFPFEIKAGGKVRKAIIPIAGYGTRMYPETHFIKKAFLPVIDNRNIVKPVILCIFEELEEAGIEEFILIIGENEEDEYKRYFLLDDEEYVGKIKGPNAEYFEKIKYFGNKIKYVVQKEKRGFGHAVYQARELLKGEPALLMLGDFIYKSNENRNCASQIVEAYNNCGGKSIIGVKSVPLEDVPHYGVIKGNFDGMLENVMNIEEMVEKPELRYAKAFLGTKVQSEEKYYITFGQYVLTEEVFVLLENRIIQSETSNSNKEIDLTDTFCELVNKNRIMALEVKGQSFDVGIPSQYFDTLINYHK